MASKDGPIFFWRETHSQWGFLSQWYEARFHDENGKVFVTAEQWMMYQKAMLFQDEDMASKIMATKDPKKQKGYGRKVANFDGLKWDLEKVRIVEEGNYHKFMHPAEGGEGDKLRLMLLETGARKLYEASPFDRIWGIGFHALNAEAFESAWGKTCWAKP